MRYLRLSLCGVVLLASVGSASASAANWDPVNTALSVTQEGTGTITTSTGWTFSCTSSAMTLSVPAATPSVAMTVGANPLTLSGCLSNGIFAMHATTFGTWHFAATDTTNVDFVATPDASGRVATFAITSLNCVITLDGPVTLPNNDWNNTSKTLKVNNTSTVNMTVDSFVSVIRYNTVIEGITQSITATTQSESNRETCATTLGTAVRFDLAYNAPVLNLT